MPPDDVAEFGGWPRPPRWVWGVAGVAAAGMLAGVVLAHAGARHAVSARLGPRALVAGFAARWPSAPGACGSTAFLPRVRLAGSRARIHGTVLVGGAVLQQVGSGGAVPKPLPGLPDHGRLVTSLVAGRGADYAVAAACGRSRGYLRVYRIADGAAHRLGITADALLGGPRAAWAVTYLAQYTLLAPELTPLGSGRAITLKTQTSPVAGTPAGLVVVAYHERASAPGTVELLDPHTGALVRRLGEGSPVGAAGHVLLLSLPGCGAPLAHRSCAMQSVDLTTGRPLARFRLPAGRVPVSAAVFSPGGTAVALQLTQAGRDPRGSASLASPPVNVAVLHLATGRLDIVPGLELAPGTQAGLAFDASGRWLLATVSEGDHGELLAWRPGMPDPALVTRLPGPLATAPPLLLAPPRERSPLARPGHRPRSTAG